MLKLLVEAAPKCATATSTAGGLTAAAMAAFHGHAEALQLLLSVAPELAARADVEGCTPAWLAAEQGHAACLELLLAVAPTSAMVPKNNGWLPIHDG